MRTIVEEKPWNQLNFAQCASMNRMFSLSLSSFLKQGYFVARPVRCPYVLPSPSLITVGIANACVRFWLKMRTTMRRIKCRYTMYSFSFQFPVSAMRERSKVKRTDHNVFFRERHPVYDLVLSCHRHSGQFCILEMPFCIIHLSFRLTSLQTYFNRLNFTSKLPFMILLIRLRKRHGFRNQFRILVYF